MSEKIIAERWTILGRVQGVGYRDWMVDTARALSVSGWVRNGPSGVVLAYVAARRSQLEQLHASCLTGPPAARVDGIQRESVSSDDVPNSFTRLPTQNRPSQHRDAAVE